MRKKMLSFAFVVVLIPMFFFGCDTTQTWHGSEQYETPPEETVTLTYWCPMPSAGRAFMNTLADSELYRELEKRTNVKISFIHPSVGEEQEQLGIMLASGDLPDMIESSFETYAGGMDQAYTDGLILDLKELQQSYAPNLMKIYETYPQILSEARNENGNFVCVPFIRGDTYLRTYRGLAIRKDWLDELNLPMPETIADWRYVLTRFQQDKGAEAPFITDGTKIGSEGINEFGTNFRTESIMGAYGIINGYFLENDKVVYGPADIRYKAYLKEMSEWYQEGLLYANFDEPNDSENVDRLVLNGEAGAMVAYVGGMVGRYTSMMEQIDPEFYLVGAPYPSLTRGEPPKFMHQEPVFNKNGAVVITTACEHPEIAMKWLDYGYSKEGHYLFNFGIEGVSYEMKDGYPHYTDIITNNPDYPFTTIATNYFRATYNGPFVQDKRYAEQYMDLPQQIETIQNWTKYAKEAAQANTKVKGTLTVEENTKVASKQTMITNYVDEMFYKFIKGTVSIEEGFAEYVKQLDQFGLQEVIEIRQAAHDRFVEKSPEAAETLDFNVSDIYQ